MEKWAQRACGGWENSPKGYPKVLKIANETEDGNGEARKSIPSLFGGLKWASRDPLGAPKTAQEGAKKAARRPKMGPRGFEDARREYPQVPRWPQEPAEMDGSSKRGARRSPRRPESSKSYVFYDVFCLLGFSGVCDSKRGGKASRTAQSGSKDGEDQPRRAPGGPQNWPSGLLERSLRGPGGARKPST